MKPEIKSYENRKKILRTALIALNVPSWPNLLINEAALKTRTLLDKLQQKFSDQEGVGFLGKLLGSQPPPQEGGATPLPDSHPLVKIAHEIAAKDGIHPVIFLNEDQPFHNAQVSEFRTADGQRAASILFHGNPLLLENGEAITRGVMGHELAHLSTSMRTPYLSDLMSSTSIYGLLAGTGFVLARTGEKLKNIDMDSLWATANLPASLHAPAETLVNIAADKPLVLGAAAMGFMTLATALPRMARSYMHATEHIADLHGAELTSLDDTVATMEYLKSIKETTKEDRSSLKKIWDKAASIKRVFNDTHPDIDKRINVLKDAFQESCGQASSGQESCDKDGVEMNSPISPNNTPHRTTKTSGPTL